MAVWGHPRSWDRTELRGKSWTRPGVPLYGAQGTPPSHLGGCTAGVWVCQASCLPSAHGNHLTVAGCPHPPGSSYWGHSPPPQRGGCWSVGRLVLSPQAGSSRTRPLPSPRLSVCLSPRALAPSCVSVNTGPSSYLTSRRKLRGGWEWRVRNRKTAVCRNVAGNLITPRLKPARLGSPGRQPAPLPELGIPLAELGRPPVTSPGNSEGPACHRHQEAHAL